MVGEAVIEAEGGAASNGALLREEVAGPTVAPIGQLELTPEATTVIGAAGERLTREEAFDLVRRAVESLTTAADAARAGDVRRRARELLGRDSESLSERNFGRILRDAHDADVIDLRRRGDDFEVARAARRPSVADQLTRSGAAALATPSAGATAQAVPSPRLGIGMRGTGPRGRAGRAGPPPPELLSVGIVPPIAPPAAVAVTPAPPLPPVAETAAAEPPPQATPADAGMGVEPEARRSGRAAARRGRGRKQAAAKRAAARGLATGEGATGATDDIVVEVSPEASQPDATPVAKRSGRAKSTVRRRGRKSSPRSGEA
jgi:hypothetical protein